MYQKSKAIIGKGNTKSAKIRLDNSAELKSKNSQLQTQFLTAENNAKYEINVSNNFELEASENLKSRYLVNLN